MTRPKPENTIERCPVQQVFYYQKKRRYALRTTYIGEETVKDGFGSLYQLKAGLTAPLTRGIWGQKPG